MSNLGTLPRELDPDMAQSWGFWWSRRRWGKHTHNQELSQTSWKGRSPQPCAAGFLGSAARNQSENAWGQDGRTQEPGPQSLGDRAAATSVGSCLDQQAACRARVPQGGGSQPCDCGDTHHPNRVCGSGSDPKPSRWLGGVLRQVKLPCPGFHQQTQKQAPQWKFPQGEPGVFLYIQIKHETTSWDTKDRMGRTIWVNRSNKQQKQTSKTEHALVISVENRPAAYEIFHVMRLWSTKELSGMSLFQNTKGGELEDL